MFLFVVGTHTKCVINEFALDARTDILIFPCHTVTNGIDLRRSPHDLRRRLAQTVNIQLQVGIILQMKELA